MHINIAADHPQLLIESTAKGNAQGESYGVLKQLMLIKCHL